MTYYYHVLGDKYEEGDAIYSLQKAIENEILTANDYQWSEGQSLEDYHDYFNISFFDNLDEALNWAEENNQSRIAKIDGEYFEYVGDPEPNEEGHLVLEISHIPVDQIVEIIHCKKISQD